MVVGDGAHTCHAGGPVQSPVLPKINTGMLNLNYTIIFNSLDI